MVLLVGCPALQPGADPVEVDAEKTVGVASDTFDTFLKMEYENVDLVRSNAPGVHKFAEYLRQPMAYQGTNYARDIVIVLQANTVRRAYKLNRSADNKASLTTALAVVSTALKETQDDLTALNALTAKPSTP